MFELIFEILGEFLVQAVLEFLAELGLHSLAEPFRKPPSPWLAAVGYCLFGLIAGGLSLLLFPTHLVAEKFRLLNLALTPVAVGLLMSALGAWRTRQAQTILRMDRFFYGFLFAFALALVRLWAAK